LLDAYFKIAIYYSQQHDLAIKKTVIILLFTSISQYKRIIHNQPSPSKIFYGKSWLDVIIPLWQWF